MQTHTTTDNPPRTPNYSAWRFVDQMKPFLGSSMIGEVYALGGPRPFLDRSAWLNDYEVEQWAKHLPRITYVVWSWDTPLAYYVAGFGWYRVGQSFSSFSGRHANGALRNVPHHSPTIQGKRGDWTVWCVKCDTVRSFTRRADADRALYPH